MADAQPLTILSVARALQQRRQSPEVLGSRRDLRVVPDIANLLGRTTSETCQFHGQKDVRGCHELRSCRNCIQRDGCMVSGYTCISEDLYSPALDYRRVGFDDNGTSIYNSSTTSQSKLGCYTSTYPNVSTFPSSTTEYCAASNSACTQSHIENRLTYAAFYKDLKMRVSFYTSQSSYCVGIDGCVCIGVCEDAAAFSHLTDLSHCRFASTRDDTIFSVILAATTLALFMYAVKTFFFKKDSSGGINTSQTAVRGLRRHMLDAAPALRLDLYGWRSFQIEMQRKEEELLAGADEVSPMARPMAFEFAAIPTAPDFDEEDESTAPTITNPHALASAPVFRLEHTGCGGDSDSRRLVEDAGIPSAPDFE